VLMNSGIHSRLHFQHVSNGCTLHWRKILAGICGLI
jgi:hypothetical protein